ncbi:hypothetical protein JNB11_00790 [Kocuria palustris]|nr:hypothetical protein [Kocuria palustris]
MDAMTARRQPDRHPLGENLSSDTYTESESEHVAAAVAQLVGATPTTLTTNLKLAVPLLPSKLILRNTQAGSPRKNVAFDPQDTMIPGYSLEELDVSLEQPTTIYHPQNVNWLAPALPLTLGGPPPPPHRTDSRQFGVQPLNNSTRPQSMDEELIYRERHHRELVESTLHLLATLMRRHLLTTPQLVVPTLEFSYRLLGLLLRLSLQLLHDENRQLPMQLTLATSQGVVLKAGGLKGFSLDAVDQLIPATHNHHDLQPLPTLTKDVQFPIDDISHLGSDDDFDRLYMLTSQLIMNILNTAGSRHTLVEDEEHEIVVKQEPDSTMEHIIVKQEPTDEIPEVVMKEEVPVNNNELSADIKDESEDSLFFNDVDTPQSPLDRDMPAALTLLPHDYPQLSPTTIDALDNLRVESVLDFGHQRAMVPRLVETGSASALLTSVTSRQVSQTEAQTEAQAVEEGAEEGTEEGATTSADSFTQLIRYELDSQWRLEHSNDGDREDNEEVTGYIDHPTLDPLAAATPKSQHFTFNDTVEEEEEAEEEVVESPTDKAVDANDSIADDALANSSNIAPPMELTYPDTVTKEAIDTPKTTEDIAPTVTSSTHSLTPLDPGVADTFEALLSAEHDRHTVAKPTSFLSIWHQQQRRHPRDVSTRSGLRGVLDPSPAATVTPKPALLPQARPQKFKGVQVVLRRVVLPLLNTTGELLPELSVDLGLASHFGFLQLRQLLGELTRLFRQPSASRTLLVTSAMAPAVMLLLTPLYSLEPLRLTAASSYNHGINEQPRRLRFRVPTFEIERTNLILSPKNMYNQDIFGDRDASSQLRSKPPTIKGYGLTTLPLMDQNDVKRILLAKQGMSHGEYAQIKLRGNSSQKTLVAAPLVDHDKLEKHALICEALLMTDGDDGADGAVDDEAPTDAAHVAREVLRTPKALRLTDQFFHDYDLFQELEFPEPDPELCGDLKYQSMYADYPLEGLTTLANYEAAATPKTLAPASPMKAPMSPERSSVSPVRAPLSPERTAVSPVRVAPSSPVRAPASPVRTAPSSPTKAPRSPLKVVAKNGEPVRRKPLGPQNIDIVSRRVLDLSQKVDDEATELIAVEKAPEAAEIEAEVDDENVQATNEKTEPELPDRGRLFFRVIGLKNVDLKDPRSREAEFLITLDNGIHCIKTAPYKLTSAHTPIGKEFELTVHDLLQFIMTLKMKYKRPQGRLVEVRQTKTVKPKLKLQQILGKKEQVVTTKFVPEQAEDTWQHKFAEDGLFARCYIDLEQYEDLIRGTASNFNLNCFNEWETIEENGRRVKAKPYRIGELEVRMLFVPRTDKHEVLPALMRQAYQLVAELQRELRNYNEGYMYQEGGDCDQMKRRFFKLEGTLLIAHLEFSHKTRAKINLLKVVLVKYTDRENIQHGSHRNFTDAMVMDNSFQIRFANGETIDFSAPLEMEKMKWIELIELIVSKNRFRRQPWVQLMMENRGDVLIEETMITGAKSKVHLAFPQRFEGKAVVA